MSYLLDSGSMRCVWPAKAGDKVDHSVKLQAVNVTSFPCFGKKKLEIKLGRKMYRFEAIIAKVKSPILNTGLTAGSGESLATSTCKIKGQV